MSTPPLKHSYLAQYERVRLFAKKAWLFSVYAIPLHFALNLHPGPVVNDECGNLTLNSPVFSPAQPVCGEEVSITFNGINLPEGELINVYLGETSGFDPASGEGELLGTVEVEYDCADCPTMLGILSDPCSGGTNEDDNELMILSSGCGMNVDDLIVDFDANNNIGGAVNSDIGGSNNCQFGTPDSDLIDQLTTGSCSNLIFPASSSDYIPGGAVVVVFTNEGTPSVPYDLQELCASGQEIYILQNGCDRNNGAFTNNPSSTRTYSVSTGACTDQIQYGFDPSYPSVSPTMEAVFRNESGAWSEMVDCSTIPGDEITIPEILSTSTSLTVTLPNEPCTELFIAGTLTTEDCELVVQQEEALEIMCPIVITPVGPLCENGGSVQLVASTSPAGSWSGPGTSSSGVFNPAVAGPGTHLITYTNPACAPTTGTINIVVNGAPILDPAFLNYNQVNCFVTATGQAEYDPSLVGGPGNSPYTYIWDDGTGTMMINSWGFIDNLLPGNYFLYLSDTNGCADTAGFEIEFFPIEITSSTINNVLCFGQSNGSININFTNPPYPTYINWDNLSMGGEQNYPGDNTQQTISSTITNLSAGTYQVTITTYLSFPTMILCTHTQSFVVGQPSAALAVNVPNFTLLCNGNNNGVLTANPTGGTMPYTYNWSNIPGVNDPQSNTGLSQGTFLLTVTDANGCTATTSAMVTQPTALVAAATGEFVDCNNNMGDITLVVSGGTPNYTYDWSNIPGTNNPQNNTGLNAGTYTVTVTDANGCTTTASATITLNPPIVTMPPDDGTTVACLSQVAAPMVPTVNDNCGLALALTGPVITGSAPCGGMITYTYTFTHPVLGAFTWTYTYTVSPPTFTLPTNGMSTVMCIAGAQVAPTPPTVTDNCMTNIPAVLGTVDPDPVCAGTKVWRYNYTDCNGNTQTWTHTYTVLAPTIIAPPADGSTVSCVDDALVAPTPPMVMDNCGNTITPSAGVPGTPPVCDGTMTWTFTYTNCNGTNSVNWVYTYTVNPSSLMLPPGGSSTVACPDDAVQPATPMVMDDCGDPISPTNITEGPDPVCSGPKVWTFTYTNCDGSTLDWLYTYTIQTPMFTVPGPGSSSVNCISDAQAVPAPPTVMDNCGNTIVPTGPVVSPDPACNGTKTYTYTYQNCDGTTQTWVYTYTILPPNFVLPMDGSTNVTCVNNAQSPPTPPMVMDNCNNSIVPTPGAVDPDPLCGGPKAYRFIYTDCDGTSLTWTYTYNIDPVTFTVGGPGSSTVPCPADAVQPTPPAVVDNCGNNVPVMNITEGADPTCAGTKTWTFTFENCDGSTQDWIYTYTISAPMFTLPTAGTQTVNCIADAQVPPAPPAVMDNCGRNIPPVLGTVDPDPTCAGTKVWRYNYTDCSGATQIWMYTYTINAPTITAPPADGSTVSCVDDAMVAPMPPIVMDNCGNTITPSAGVPGTPPVCSGPMTWTFTYTNCNGTNSVNWVYTYTVDPSSLMLPPGGSSTVACPDDAVQPATPSVMDDCGDPIMPTNITEGPDPVCSGPKVWTFTYTNCDGSTLDWLYTYTIQTPMFTVPGPGSSSVNCISDAQAVPAPPTVMDNCGNTIAPTGPVVSPDPACNGTKTYTYTYQNCDGTTQTWVYTYTILPPNFVLPMDGSTNVTCVNNAQSPPTPPTVMDNCNNPIVPTPGAVDPDPLCGGPKAYRFIYTDCDGTSLTWTYTYNIDPVTFTVGGPGSSTVPCPADAVQPTPPPVTDNCGNNVPVMNITEGADPTCAGIKTWTFTYENCDGSTQDWIYTYTISAPMFTLPTAGTQTVNCIADAQVPPSPPAVMDNCGRNIPPVLGTVDPDPTCAGTKVWRYNYTDCSGATQTWMYTYTINAPTITAPPADGSTVSCVDDALVAPTPPMVMDNCGNTITPSAGVPGTPPVCSGPMTWTFTYTNCNGTNSVNWVYTYTVDPSSLMLPTNGSATVPCPADAVQPATPSVMDDCGNPISPSNISEGADPTCSGTKVWTFTYTNCDGSTLDWLFTYTIQAPMFTVPGPGSSTVDCISDAQAVPAPPTVMDNCGNTILPTGPVVSPDPLCDGTKTYTFTYDNCDGSSQTWVYTYTILPPTFTIPVDGSQNVACVGDAQTPPTPPMVMDNCGNTIIPTPGAVDPDPLCGGNKAYRFNYQGCDGSVQTWTFTYTIDPVTFTVGGPGSSTVDCPADAVQPTPPAVTDNCGNIVPVMNITEGADPTCAGSKTWTFTYENCDGSTQDWIYTYTISAPMFTLPANGTETVDCIADAQVAPAPPAVADNCGRNIMPVLGTVDPDPTCSGTKVWRYNYTDCSGATQTWTYTYTINPPTFTLPGGGSTTVDCVADAVQPAPPTVMDNCGNNVPVSNIAEGTDPVCIGTKTWTFTFENCDGSTQDWVYTYTITAPTIVLPADGASTVDCIADAQAVPTPPTVMDNCGNTIVPTPGAVDPDPICSGTKSYRFDYENCDGSIQTWTYTYTINAPLVTFPSNGATTVDCIADAQVQPVPPTVTDNCGNNVPVINNNEGPDPVCSGDKVWTFTYEYCDGSTQDWTYTYTINPPTFTIPTNGSQNVPCVGDAQTPPTPPTVMDNCGTTIIPTPGAVDPDPACGGNKVYRFDYEGCDGTVQTWTFTYTIDPVTFTLPSPGSSIVDCPADAVQPATPTVTDNCGNNVPVMNITEGADPTCSGTKIWTFTFENCDGSTQDWIYTYTINPPVVTLPSNGTETVDCIADAQVAPTPPAVTDNCGRNILPVLGTVDPDPTCSGTKVWRYNYTDCSGATQTWTYTYTINPPTFTLPGGGSTTVDCVADAVQPAPPTVMDNCGNNVPVSNIAEGTDPVCSGTKTWTFTFENCDGSTQDWVYTYTITAPTIVLPADGASTVDCIADAQVVPTPPTVMDNCGNTIVPTPGAVDPDPICSGTKSYRFDYENCDGSIQTWTYTYTINAPTVTFPSDGASTVDCIADAQVQPVPPTVTDNCGNNVPVINNNEGPDPVCSGDKVWTFTYEYCDGSTQDWTYTYTINPPTFTVPADGSQNVACVGDAQTPPTPPTVMDNCGNTIVPTPGAVDPDPTCGGDKAYRFDYESCDGTIQTWTFIYTIDPPVFVLPAPGNSNVDCPADAVQPATPTVTDNCGNDVPVMNITEGADPTCNGTKTWTFTYENCDGSTQDWIYTYTISAPMFTLPSNGTETVDCIADAQTPPTPPSVTDNCGRNILPVLGTVDPDPTCSGTKVWRYDYTDCSGATQTWTYTYTINPPTFTLPGGGSATVDCVADAVQPAPPSVVDNCGGSVTVSNITEGTDPVCSGTKTWTFTFESCDGSTQDWVFTYTVTAPTVTLPADGGTTVDCVSDAQVPPVPPTVVDNCGNTIIPTAGPVDPDPICSGTKSYQFDYENCDGSIQTWTYTYTINSPTVTFPADGVSIVDCIADAQVQPVPPTVTDNCGNSVPVINVTEGADPVCSGDKVWTFTYEYCDGSTQDWTHTYTINPPTFTIPADGSQNVGCVDDAQVPPTPPAVTDNCGNAIVPVAGTIDPDPTCGGNKAYRFDYTDCNGNTQTWTHTYIIDPPVFVLPAPGSSSVDCIADAVQPAPPAVVDNCGNNVPVLNITEGVDPVCSGTKIWTFTYENCDGSTDDWIYTYTINAPAFTLPADGGTTVDCVGDAQVEPTPPAVTNDCGDPVIPVLGTVDPDPTCGGDKVWRFVYTNCDGSTEEWQFIYTINPPTFVLPADDGTTIDCAADAVEPVPPTVTDNCGNAVPFVSVSEDPDPACVGTKAFIFTYEDCLGNPFNWTYTYTINPGSFVLPAPDGSTIDCVGDAIEPVPPVVTDNCGNAIPVSSGVDSPDPVCSGTKTWTFTYTSCDGTTQDWVYTYTINAPGFTLPPGGTGTVDCADDAIEPVPPIVTDNCGNNVPVSSGVEGADPVCSGTKTWTFTYTNCDGSTQDWVFTYTVNGDTGPVFDAPPADVTVDCVLDVPAMIDLGYSNSCTPGGTVTGSDSPIMGSCPATITRTWTVTDACGNESTATQNITVNDITPPTASTPSPIDITTCNDPIPGPDIAVITDAADNCSAPVVAFVSDNVTLSGCTETTERIYSVTDACNNVINITQIITRTVDVDPPVFDNPPADITVTCENQIPALMDLTYTDNCIGAGSVTGVETGVSPSITYTWTISDACGNEATHVQTITVDEVANNVTVTDAFCSPNTYTLPDGTTTTTGGVFGPFTLVAANGCDSLVTVDLTLSTPDNVTIMDVTCYNVPYILPDGTPTTLEILHGPFSFINIAGCDSIVWVDLTVNPDYSTTITDAICNGDIYTLPDGTTTTVGGNYGPFTFPDVNGCDSNVTVVLNEFPSPTVNESDEFCEGDTYILPDGTPTDVGGDFVFMFTTANGCDSTLNFHLEMRPIFDVTIDDAFCDGTIYTLPDGTTTTTGGTFGPFTLQTIYGCDSLVTVVLQSITAYDIELDDSFCEGTLYNLPDGTTTDMPGSYGPFMFVSVDGCDSLVTVELTQIDTSEIHLTEEICENETVTLPDGTTTDMAGSYGPFVFTNVAGCDSTIYVEVNVTPAYDIQIEEEICQGEVVILPDGTPEGDAGVYPFMLTSVGGCDSMVTVTIVVHDVYDEVITDMACEDPPYILPDGSTTTSSGMYGPYMLTSEFGCDSLVTIDLTIVDVLEEELDPTICQGDTYILPDGTPTTIPGTYGPFSFVSSLGCDSLVTVNLSVQNPTVTIQTPTDPLCVTAPALTLQATPAGGVWSGAVTSDQFDPAALGVGSHTVTYTYTVGTCEDSESITIDVYELTISCEATVQESAPGAGDGEGQVTISGGFPNYDISWTGPSSGTITLANDGSFVITGLTAGVYVVTAVDANGCEATCSFTVTSDEPCTLVIDNVVIVDASCEGVNNGSIEIIASGGTPDYMYSIDGVFFGPDNIFTGLTPGNYIAYVQDDGGCSAQQVVTVGAGAGPVIAVDNFTPSSCGLSNGGITISVSGGTPDYLVSHNGGIFEAVFEFTGLTAGDHTFVAQDENGCTGDLTFDLPTENGPEIDAINTTDAACGQSNGTITIIASGGTMPYEYSFDGGNSWQAGNVENGLPSGDYVVAVRDDSGCEVYEDVSISNQDGPTISNIAVVDATCAGGDGSITITASGVNPLSYIITGYPSQSSNVFNGLNAGVYTVTVTDANMCSSTATANVQSADGPQIDDINVTHTDCGLENGAIQVIVSGGAEPITYDLDGDDNTTGEWDDYEAGTYQLTVTDDNGCSVTATIVIDGSVGPILDYIIEPDHCGLGTGSIDMDGSGSVGPYTYSIDGEDGPFSPNPTYPGLDSDFYVIAVRDGNGCIVSEEVFVWEVDGPEIEDLQITPPPCGSNVGEIIVDASGTGTLEYGIQPPLPVVWSTNSTITNVSAGNITVWVRDMEGCSTSQMVVMPMTPSPTIVNIGTTDPDCGEENGSIIVTANGGTAPLQYQINNQGFVDENDFDGLGSGFYVVEVSDANGCTDTETIQLLSTGGTTSNLDTTICPGEVLTLHGNTFDMEGTYSVPVPGGSANGCDSTIILTLDIDEYQLTILTETICANEQYVYNGVIYDEEGTHYLDTLTAIVGCDSIIRLDLTVDTLLKSQIDTAICTGESIVINGTIYDQAGTFVIDTLDAVSGCDTVLSLVLSISEYIPVDTIVNICEGEVFTYDGVDYDQTGVFELDTIVNPTGCDTILTLRLTVEDLPIVNAGPDQMLDCDITTVTLTPNQIAGTPLWTGPGINAGNENSWNPSVTEPGIYTLTVTVNGECSGSDDVEVIASPDVVVANAGDSATLSCIITEVTLNAQPVGGEFTYEWTGPGITPDNENDQSLTLTTPGTYVLVVTNTTTNCVSEPDTVVISDIAVNIVAIIQDPDILTCFTTSINIDGTESSTGPNVVYVWYDRDGNVIGDAPMLDNIEFGGEFTIIVTDTVSGCFDSDTVMVTDLTAYPPVEAGPDQSLDCNESSVILNEGAANHPANIDLLWTGPGILTDPTLVTVTVNQTGYYYLTATDEVTGCVNYDSVQVFDLTTPVVAEIEMIEAITCIDESALLGVGNSTSGTDILYTWNGPDVTNQTGTTLEVFAPGVYTLTVLNQANGCSETASITVDPADPPVGIDVDVQAPSCEGDTSGFVIVTGINGGLPPFTYTFDGDVQNDSLINGLMAGTYPLLVTDANGCTYQINVVVPDGPELEINIGIDILLELGDSLQLNPVISIPWSEVDSIVWTPSEILSCNDCQNPYVYGLESGVVMATIYNGLCIDDDILNVSVNVEANIYIPNVFSPNDDFVNDWLTVYSDERVKEVVFLQIFDRWGNMVYKGEHFQTNVDNLGWNGKFKDQPMNPGVFAYNARVELINGTTVDLRGDITLVR